MCLLQEDRFILNLLPTCGLTKMKEQLLRHFVFNLADQLILKKGKLKLPALSRQLDAICATVQESRVSASVNGLSI